MKTYERVYRAIKSSTVTKPVWLHWPKISLKLWHCTHGNRRHMSQCIELKKLIKSGIRNIFYFPGLIIINPLCLARIQIARNHAGSISSVNWGFPVHIVKVLAVLNSYFIFYGNLYHQTEGLGMGLPSEIFFCVSKKSCG